MKDILSNIKVEFEENMEKVNNLDAVKDIKVKYFGKKGQLSSLMSKLKDATAEEKKEIGKDINLLKEELISKLESKTNDIEQKIMNAKLEKEKIDVTLPGNQVGYGHFHPIYNITTHVKDIFKSMGFSIVIGPEVDTVYNNFDALNTPSNHPSKDVTDTFYIGDNLVLRTHTSPVQIRTMMNNELPLKVISPGRCFRKDELDATHSPMFHQVEGLVIDKGISFGDLKGTLEMFVKLLFGDDIKSKFRPHDFPFTEPSGEVDITCFKCKGKGCRVCKNSGWIEILGCGMVHPNVLKSCNIDPEVYSGFAFGMGLDRIAMLKYEIDNIKHMFENNISFLEQF